MVYRFIYFIVALLSLFLYLVGCESPEIKTILPIETSNRCKKDFVFNSQKGEVEYIVFEKECIREYALFNNKELKDQPCYKFVYPTESDSIIVSNYYCLKETKDSSSSFTGDMPQVEKRKVANLDNPPVENKAENKAPEVSNDIPLVVDKDMEEAQSKCSKQYPGMKCIPAGYFIRGSNKYKANESPEEKVYISEFYMDVYEVTNADFQKCLDAGKCADCLKNGKCKDVQPAYGARYQRPKQPIVGISWYSARDYCAFVGKRLPTEAEWEKAARGPNGNLYPWGNEPATCKLAIIEEEGRKGCAPARLEPPKMMPTQDIGLKPPGIYGLYDMAGNSWEWVNDFYTSSYESCGEACRGKDPKGPCAGREPCPGHSRKVLKGGSWWWPSDYARGSYRRSHDPKNYPEYHHFGFRCAKD